MSGLTTAYVLSKGARIDTNGQNITIAQGLLDAGSGGGLTKLGSGTLTLSGTNTYTGPTAINAGTLVVTGSLAKTAVSVGGGASLGGRGGSPAASPWPAAARRPPRAASTSVDGQIGTLTLTDTNAADTVLTLGGTAAGKPSLLDFELGTAADRILLSAGKLAVNPGGGKINLTVLGSVATGTYDLIDYGAGQASGLGALESRHGDGPAGRLHGHAADHLHGRAGRGGRSARHVRFRAGAVIDHLRRSRALDTAPARCRRPRPAGDGVAADGAARSHRR